MSLPILELPVELAALIFDTCEVSTLLALCLTSRACRAIAQRSLYRQVDLHTLAESVSCFRTLIARPDLASVMREFLVMFDSKDRIFPIFWVMLSKTLSLTQNLVSLHFAMQGPSSIVFRHCSLPRLRVLSSVLDLSVELQDFLSRHPSIKQLCIGGEAPNQHLPLPASALPVLETYLGSRTLARDLVPGRPVSHVTLAWTPRIPEDEIEDVIRTLATGTVPIRHFGCTTFGGDANRGILCALAEHLPCLYTLRINNVSSGRPLDEKFVHTVASVVRCFKELSRLDIPCLACANDDQEAYDDAYEAEEVKTVVGWKAACPTLDVITLPSCMTWRFQREQGVWTRETDGEAVAGVLL